MKRTLDLNIEIRELNGELIKPETAGKWLATILVQSPKGDAIKYLDWAITLNGNQPIEVDESDFNTLREFVKDHPGLPNLVKAPLLKAMIKAENTGKEPLEKALA